MSRFAAYGRIGFSAIALLFLATSLMAGTARRSPELCDLPAPMRSFSSPRQMPRSIIELVRQQNAPVDRQPMAERDATFNPTDVIRNDLPRQRFIQGAQHEDRWAVYYERGGYALTSWVIVFEMAPTASRPKTLAEATNVSGDACQQLVSQLSQRP